MHDPPAARPGGVDGVLNRLSGVSLPGIVRPVSRHHVIQGLMHYRQRLLAILVPGIRKIVQEAFLVVGKIRRPVFRIQNTAPALYFIAPSVIISGVNASVIPGIFYAGVIPTSRIIPATGIRVWCGAVCRPAVWGGPVLRGISPRIHPRVPTGVAAGSLRRACGSKQCQHRRQYQPGCAHYFSGERI